MGQAQSVVEVEHVDLTTPGARAVVVYFNRPDQLNAINWDVLRELDSALQDADRDPSVRTILLTGRGRAFSSGGDLNSYLTLQKDPQKFQAFLDDFLRVAGSIKYLRKPVVALVNGVTAAGGLEILLACDFAYAAESARIGDAHLTYAQMAGAGSLSLLPRIVGPFRARELFFSARLLGAAEALDWGLVTKVVPDDALLRTGIEFAESVGSKSPTAVANAKYAMNAGWADGTGLEAALRIERERASLYILTEPDSMEGLQAFAEKRKPSFPVDRNDKK